MLIVGCNRRGRAWAEAALVAVKSFAITLKIVVMWPHASFPQRECWQGREGNVTEAEWFAVQKWASASRVVHAEVDPGWWDVCGVPDTGAILIRPDEHVAWRSRSVPDSSSVQQLHKAFAQVFPVPASSTQTVQERDISLLQVRKVN